MNLSLNSRRGRLLTAAGLISAGAVVGGVLGLTGAASAATTTTTGTASTTWHSNTDPAHEAGESAARAAAEKAADARGVPPVDTPAPSSTSTTTG